MRMTLKNKPLVFALAAGFAFATGVGIFTLTRTSGDPSSYVQSVPTSPGVSRDNAVPAEYGALQSAVAAVHDPSLRADLEKIYAIAAYRPLWENDRGGRKRLKALDPVVRSLNAQGLDAHFISEAKNDLATSDSVEARQQADLALTAAVLRAARGQRFGFIDAKSLGWHIASDESDVATHLGEALSGNDLAEFFDGLAPQDPQFRVLTDALNRYRAIADAGGWAPIPGNQEIDFAGDSRISTLRARLVAEGYVAANADTNTVIEALKVYQSRNGLEPDGRAGRATLAALNVPIEERIGQIVANLERRRHMRHNMPDDYIVANIADQTVTVIRSHKDDLRLRTVVGSRRHATPMIEATMTAVTLNPPWHVPTSIITREILPKLDADPQYLEDNNMHVVAGSWDDPKSLRVRQNPGPGNSLGHVKFEMQNQWNIYLHDTPSRSLFEKPDRYFSHGCVRVDQPEELAQTLLSGHSVADLKDIIASGETRTLSLENPLPVLVLYWSVFADVEGRLQFRRDAYARDSQTVSALAMAGLYKNFPQVVDQGN